MKQNDAIENVRDNTYIKYSAEHGIGEIMGGLYMIVFGAIGIFHGWSIYPFFFLVLSYRWRAKLKQKYVYPRVGVAHFDEKPKSMFKIKSKSAFIVPAYFVFIALFGLASVFLGRDNAPLNYIYANLLITSALGLMIIGSLRRSPKFYLYALMIMMIIVNPTLFFGDILYLVTAMTACCVTVYLLEKHMFKDKKKFEDKASAYSGHNIILILATLTELYMVLTLNHAPIINNVNLIITQIWGSTESLALFQWVLVCFVAAYFLRTYRFILYAVLTISYQCMPYLVPSFHVTFWEFIIFLGAFMSLIGFYVLVKFVRKYPILEAAYEG